jgi:hypothetical protein
MHFVRMIECSKKLQKPHPIADPMFMLLSKHDPNMCYAACSHLYVIGIVGAEHISHSRSPLQVVGVTIT